MLEEEFGIEHKQPEAAVSASGINEAKWAGAACGTVMV